MGTSSGHLTSRGKLNLISLISSNWSTYHPYILKIPAKFIEVGGYFQSKTAELFSKYLAILGRSYGSIIIDPPPRSFRNCWAQSSLKWRNLILRKSWQCGEGVDCPCPRWKRWRFRSIPHKNQRRSSFVSLNPLGREQHCELVRSAHTFLGPNRTARKYWPEGNAPSCLVGPSIFHFESQSPNQNISTDFRRHWGRERRWLTIYRMKTRRREMEWKVQRAAAVAAAAALAKEQVTSGEGGGDWGGGLKNRSRWARNCNEVFFFFFFSGFPS